MIRKKIFILDSSISIQLSDMDDYFFHGRQVSKGSPQRKHFSGSIGDSLVKECSRWVQQHILGHDSGRQVWYSIHFSFHSLKLIHPGQCWLQFWLSYRMLWRHWKRSLAVGYAAYVNTSCDFLEDVNSCTTELFVTSSIAFFFWFSFGSASCFYWWQLLSGWRAHW